MQLPPNIADRVRYPAPLVDRVRNLAQSLLDAQIADRLNREGQVSAIGKPFTAFYDPVDPLALSDSRRQTQEPEELTVQQVAEQFRVSTNVVYYWIERGVIQARRLNAGMPYWITLSEADEQKLRDWVRNSRRIRTTS